MKVISKGRVIKRGVLLYRKVRYRKGHGVHSPFVFRFITKVIDERASYYCLHDIEQTRKRVSSSRETFQFPVINNPDKDTSLPAKSIVHKLVLKPRSGGLLMRTTNFLNPQTTIQIGCTAGFSSLYLSGFSATAKLTVLEKNSNRCSFAHFIFKKHGRKDIDLIEGQYHETLLPNLNKAGSIDLIYLDSHNTPAENRYTLEQCLPYIHEKSALIIAGIKSSDEMKKFWKEVCNKEEISISIDVYEFGIAFFNKKLYKRNYIVSF